MEREYLLMTKIVLSPTAEKEINSLTEKDKIVARLSIKQLSYQETNKLVSLQRVHKLAGGTDYYSFHASSDLRINFLIENSNTVIIIDITRSPYSRAGKTFLRLFVISFTIFSIFIFWGTIGSNFPILHFYPSPTPTPTIYIMPTLTLTSTLTPNRTPTYTHTSTPTISSSLTEAPPTYTPYPTYTLYPTNTPAPTPTSTRIPIISSEVMNISGWVVGTAISCLTAIFAFVGLITTIILKLIKESRESALTKLEYRKKIIELEKVEIELKNIKGQKTRNVRK